MLVHTHYAVLFSSWPFPPFAISPPAPCPSDDPARVLLTRCTTTAISPIRRFFRRFLRVRIDGLQRTRYPFYVVHNAWVQYVLVTICYVRLTTFSLPSKTLVLVSQHTCPCALRTSIRFRTEHDIACNALTRGVRSFFPVTRAGRLQQHADS